jgi:molybdopterin-guanine dinucleotide biosynthesis protein A
MRREGFLAYGARQMTECVCALEACLSALAPDDLRAVEDALAAAHRLQTCLTLFAKGYPSPRVALWKRRLRRIVRALNALRDCLRLAEWIAAQQPPPECVAGVRRALLRLRQRAETLHQTLRQRLTTLARRPHPQRNQGAVPTLGAIVRRRGGRP